MTDRKRPNCEAPDSCRAKGNGHCRSCHMRAAAKANWQDPEFRAKQAAATKANWQDPEFRAKQAAAVKANWQDPEFRARNAAAVKAAAREKLSWCPPDLIEDYRLLMRHLGAKEARAAIEQQIATRGAR